jgi:CDP-diacylglycerol--glycerol-3-phosphate 3-phosphatidyltransferase
MNVPNTITVGRLVLAILFFGTLSVYRAGLGTSWILYLALALFLVAALTDWVDGYIARRLGMVTAFGRVADPLVDKILILGAFIYFLSLAHLTHVQAWMVVVILARELLVTGIRSLAESKGIQFSALYFGKAKMWVQSITAIWILVYLAHFQEASWAVPITRIAVYVTVAVTAASLIPYVRKAMAEVLT